MKEGKINVMKKKKMMQKRMNLAMIRTKAMKIQ